MQMNKCAILALKTAMSSSVDLHPPNTWNSRPNRCTRYYDVARDSEEILNHGHWDGWIQEMKTPLIMLRTFGTGLPGCWSILGLGCDGGARSTL